MSVCVELIYNNFLSAPSLIGADVVSVAGGICGSCQFTNDSIAKGCTIKLYNDNHTFYFDVSHPTHRDTSLLECFEVSTPGLFHVEIIEVADNASKDYLRLELSDVVISHKAVQKLSNGMRVILLCAWVCCLSQMYRYPHTKYSNSSWQYPSSDWSFSCARDRPSLCDVGCVYTLHIPREKKTPKQDSQSHSTEYVSIVIVQSL